MTASSGGSAREEAGRVAAARTASTNAARSRPASSSPAAKTCSNWSMIKTSRDAPAACAISLSSRCASPGAAARPSRITTGSRPPSCPSWAASSVSGRVPGVMLIRGHEADPGTCTPRASAGTRPAPSSEVLPAPDAPVSMTRPDCTSEPASAAVSCSRPKNTASWAPP